MPHTIDLKQHAKHGYFFPKRATHYNHKAAEESWNATFKLFAHHLNIK